MDNKNNLKIDELKSFFSKSDDLSGVFSQYACVSILIKLKESSYDVGFIQRAEQEDDHWSGHIAFPGGRHELDDASAFDTVLRETEEEIGLKLSDENSIFLGRLNDIQAKRKGAELNFFIRPFVFVLKTDVEFNIDPTEVEAFFWTSKEDLVSNERVTQHSYFDGLNNLNFPGINLGRKFPLWGLTYLMTKELIAKFNY